MAVGLQQEQQKQVQVRVRVQLQLATTLEIIRHRLSQHRNIAAPQHHERGRLCGWRPRPWRAEGRRKLGAPASGPWCRDRRAARV
jgi:hypothetical protein